MFRHLSMLVLIVVMIAAATPLGRAEAAAPPALKLGSNGPDVPDLQYRLQLLGHYHASTITTYYGAATRNAVSRFQKVYGLPADGIAGSRTWAALKKVSVSKPELSKLARVVYSEARGEPYKGQVAVGAVVMNRLQSPLFPHTLTEVIMEPYAFTAVMDGQYWLLPDATAFQAAKDAVKGWDPTGHALFYYNPDTATSQWIRTREIILRIGSHVFTK
ncbi:cell wall hydrolase [Paenibacillus oenotherae]|uniref:Cell wall hydrolase n=1 Tax=Paenibacillus oenotherae TaxID=1435645 RepID=A0ABS7D1B9_9BACL|nr:cell wall hydrolase [Paenibacillus oenotherae]MBW7473166.1 cell wall hydrolase [Paenibacillus oenotherae]